MGRCRLAAESSRRELWIVECDDLCDILVAEWLVRDKQLNDVLFPSVDSNVQRSLLYLRCGSNARIKQQMPVTI